jgi:hypothetical protein
MASVAQAQEKVETEDAAEKYRIGYDLEVDPIAYALGGFSVHAGIRHAFLRIDLGAFAAQPPVWFHGSKGVTVYQSGFGLKCDYRFFADQHGLFIGAEAATARVQLQPSDGGLAQRQRTYNFGVRTGWEFELLYGFYVVPWIGVGAALGGEDTTMLVATGDREVSWKHKTLVIFPTVHIGWRGGKP